MSYASVASHNIPADQPEPSQDLLDGHFEGETQSNPTADIDHKINVLPTGSDVHHPDVNLEGSAPPPPVKMNPATPDDVPSTSSVAPEPLPAPSKSSVKIPQSGSSWEEKQAKLKKEVKNGSDAAKKKGKEFEKKAEDELKRAESTLAPYWEKTKDVVLRPGFLGGTLGVVNVGLIATLGYFAYTNRNKPWDRRLVAGAVAGTLALFGGEGYLAESYLSTPEGKREAERAKKEGSKFYLHAKEVVLRPSVAGGLVGAFNLAVISTVGYLSYKHWNQPWDRRVVSAITVGILALSGAEGYAAKVYKDEELPKH